MKNCIVNSNPEQEQYIAQQIANIRQEIQKTKSENKKEKMIVEQNDLIKQIPPMTFDMKDFFSSIVEYFDSMRIKYETNKKELIEKFAENSSKFIEWDIDDTVQTDMVLKFICEYQHAFSNSATVSDVFKNMKALKEENVRQLCGIKFNSSSSLWCNAKMIAEHNFLVNNFGENGVYYSIFGKFHNMLEKYERYYLQRTIVNEVYENPYYRPVNS